MALTFRDWAARLAPPRLRGWVGSRLLYSLAAPLDALGDIANAAVKARFPETAPPDALPYLGRDRRIRRGPNESADNYRARLLLWLEAWRGAGVGKAMLDQLAGYVSPSLPAMRIATQNGVWYTRAANGTFSVYHHSLPTNFNWDGVTANWARFAVIIYPPADLWTVGPAWGGAGLWGTGWGGSGATWGTTATLEQVQTIRAIIDDMKPATSRCERVIIAFDAASFDPTAAPGAPMPDGTWGLWSKIVGGAYVPSRLSTARYWEGC